MNGFSPFSAILAWFFTVFKVWRSDLNLFQGVAIFFFVLQHLPATPRVILDRADGCCWKVLKDEKNIAALYRLSWLKGPLRTLREHPDFELFRTFRQISRNSRAARHLPCAVIKLFRSVDIGPMAHIPCHVPRRSLASSGPSTHREAPQIARNIAFLGTRYGRAPFFGKVPSVEFLLQRYRGA